MEDVDIFEINEAFASQVSLFCIVAWAAQLEAAGGWCGGLGRELH